MSNWENRTPTDVLSHLDEKCLFRRKRSWGQFWMHPLFHTVTKELALQVSKIAVLQHQLNCFINRKSSEDKTINIYGNSIISTASSFSLYSQLNNTKLSRVPWHFMSSVNQCKRQTKSASCGFSCTFPLQTTELLSTPPLKMLPSPRFQQSLCSPFPSKAPCLLSQPCLSCFDLTHSHSPLRVAAADYLSLTLRWQMAPAAGVVWGFFSA